MDNSIFDELVIVKRSGQRVSFNGSKIAIAIKKAFDSVYQNYDTENVNKVYSNVLKYISSNYSDRKTINVEDIQDIIENTLKKDNFNEVYYSFNNYRLKRKASREIFDRKQQHKFVRATEKLVLRAQDESNSNPIEQLLSFGKTISLEFSKAYLLDSKYVRNHDEGNIYIHDLDYYVLGTTKSSHLDLSSINSYENYFDKIIEILLNFKKEQYGEHSITSIDYLFEPYLLYKFKKILKEKLNNQLEIDGFIELLDIKGIESLIDKLENIYFNIADFDKYLINEKIKSIFIYAYKYTEEYIKDDLYNNIKKLLITLNEMNFSINEFPYYSISLGTNNNNTGLLINEIYLDVINDLNTLNNVTTIYKINNTFMEKISKLIMSGKNIALSNVLASYNKKYLIKDNYKSEIEYFKDGIRIKENITSKSQYSVGRMILSETSLNLVRIALKSKNIKEFYINLNDTMELVKNELLQTFEYKSNKYKENFKYLFKDNIIFDSEKLENGGRIRKVIKNGTLNLCYAGLKEASYVLLKKNKLTNDDLKISLDIVKHMSDICNEYKNEYKLNFCLRETYEEEILKYFNCLDKSIYGKKENVTDSNEYSSFYKIFNDIDIGIEDRFKIESKIMKYSDGGYYEIINIPKNYSYKKIIEIINIAKSNDIGYLKIIVGNKV